MSRGGGGGVGTANKGFLETEDSEVQFAMQRKSAQCNKSEFGLTDFLGV